MWDAQKACDLRCLMTVAENSLRRAYKLNDHETAEVWGRTYHRAAIEFKTLTGVDPRPSA